MMQVTARMAMEKAIIVFDAMKRMHGKGNSGLEAARGAEEQWELDTAIAEKLREILRALEAGEIKLGQPPEARANVTEIRGWQRDIIENGVPERLVLKDE